MYICTICTCVHVYICTFMNQIKQHLQVQVLCNAVGKEEEYFLKKGNLSHALLSFTRLLTQMHDTSCSHGNISILQVLLVIHACHLKRVSLWSSNHSWLNNRWHLVTSKTKFNGARAIV